MIDPKLQQYIYKWISITENQMKNILIRNGKGNSRLINRLKLKTLFKPNGDISISTNLPDYAIFVDKGRRRGKMPPIKTIREWCIRKGIDKSLAYPIARHIGKNGLKATNFTEPLHNIRDLISAIQKRYVEKVKEELKTKDINITIK